MTRRFEDWEEAWQTLLSGWLIMQLIMQLVMQLIMQGRTYSVMTEVVNKICINGLYYLNLSRRVRPRQYKSTELN